jgi:hypothetical protein
MGPAANQAAATAAARAAEEEARRRREEEKQRRAQEEAEQQALGSDSPLAVFFEVAETSAMTYPHWRLILSMALRKTSLILA